MKRRRIWLILLPLVALLAMSGCGWLENAQVFKEENRAATEDGAQEQEVVLEDDLDLESSSAEQADEGAATAESDNLDANAENGAAVDEAPAPSVDTRRITLYFAAADGTLSPETRDIPKQEGIARATLNELIAGPQDESLLPTLPAGTILEGINIADGLCTVDLSSELVADLSQDTDQQLLALYSVVNTLCQFETVEQVRILVDGQALPTSIGGVDASAALAPADLL